MEGVKNGRNNLIAYIIQHILFMNGHDVMYVRYQVMTMGCSSSFLDGYCSAVQGLLDWFEADLGFTEILFIHEWT